MLDRSRRVLVVPRWGGGPDNDWYPWLCGQLSARGLVAVRAAAGPVTAVMSTNDPFVAGAAANRRLWEDRLGARVVVVPGAAHVNRPFEPAVLDALLEHLA